MKIQTTNTIINPWKVFQIVSAYSGVLTLPLFFVLDAFNQFWYWIPTLSGIIVFFTLITVILLLFCLIKLIFSDNKAYIILLWTAFCYLFFKSIKDWLVSTAGLKLFASYSFYLSFLFLLTILFLIIIHKLSLRGTRKLCRYLNILLLILVTVEIGKSGYNFLNKHADPFTTKDLKFASLLNKKQYPDVFILLFDEYAGSYALSNEYGFDNSKFVDGLKKRSFHVAKTSNSNYNGTPFSVLSLLNMAYIEDVKRAEVESAIAYSKSIEAIKDNELMRFFRNNGYRVLNHSFLEVNQTESLNYLFLPIKERLMLDKTFGSVLLNDLICTVNSNSFHYFMNDFPARIDEYNQEVIKKSFETIKANKSPVFMYAHFMMPHSPFLRDSSGRLRNIGKAYRESNRGINIESYVQYLKYCNTVSLKMIDSIKENKPNSVIVLLSDHGLRNSRGENSKYSEFNNFIAIYSPDKDGFHMPDSLCTVNTFRLILNKHFDQVFPILDNQMINVNIGLGK